MATPLAWKNLKHNRVRTAVGMAGVGFAAMLIFMQMGFMGAIQSTATQIYDALDFDLMIRSPAYLHLTEARSFPAHRLLQARGVPGVVKARPFHISLTEWQTPTQSAPRVEGGGGGGGSVIEGIGRGIIVMGVNPNDAPYAEQHGRLREQARLLTSSQYVLVDTKTTAEYGPQQGAKFGEADIGVCTALGPQEVQIVGLFELGAGMVCNGATVTNIEGFFNACPIETRGEVNLGLVKLEPGADAEQAAAAIREALGVEDLDRADVEVLTRDEVARRERRRWTEETPFGSIFKLGVAVSLFVGVAIVYQVLSTDIANMMGEYATLKAIGYSNDYLSSVVIVQSVLLALVAFAPSLLIAYGLYELIEWRAGIPMRLTLPILLSVLGLTVTMCLVSGLAALRKLFGADPASLF